MIAELKADGTLEFEMQREFPFPRALVYETWLDQDHLKAWMGPSPDINVCDIELDARVGGSYRMGFLDNDEPEQINYVHGEYLEIAHEERLVFSWIWEEPLEEAGDVTLVTVDFADSEKGTLITLKHQKFTTDASCTRHREGWAGTLVKLGGHLKA